MPQFRTVLLSAVFLASPVQGQTGLDTEIMKACIAEQITAEELVTVKGWFVFNNPAFGDLINVGQDSLDYNNQAMAGLVTALMSERCADETRAAYAADGDAALGQIYVALLDRALRELLALSTVNEQMMVFVPLMDWDKVAAVLQ